MTGTPYSPQTGSTAFDASAAFAPEDGLSPADLLAMLLSHWKLLVTGSLVAGALALGYSYTLPPTFTALTTMLPPQQPQSSAASALASLGSLAGLAGVGSGARSPAEQYVALMESATIGNRIVEGMKLVEGYGQAKASAARAILAGSTTIGVNKHDGLIVVQVSDSGPGTARTAFTSRLSSASSPATPPRGPRSAAAAGSRTPPHRAGVRRRLI